MSKIAQYLNEHMLGEITSSKSIRERYSRDASVLSITPELVMFPRVTNDIRKAARFSWQLAEKGHIMPITVRGAGSDSTGAAIGKGLIINTTTYLNRIMHIALKDKDRFVHVQPGVTFQALNDTLNWHGLYVPTFPDDSAHATIGGAVANNGGGQLSGKFGLTGEWVSRLEVVLANGDLIETTRLSKKDISKKIGLQTFEGEIYRKLDGLLEDNQELINEKLNGSDRDNTGYARIAQVKQKDGSFDLTPLMVGSQGTLGIISEIVMKTEYISKDQTILVACVENSEVARDASDALKNLDPTSIETFDGSLFEEAKKLGKSYPFAAPSDEQSSIGAVMYIVFTDFSDSARSRKLKKATKILRSKFSASVISSEDHTVDELVAIRDVAASLYISEPEGHSYAPLMDGASIPNDRHEDFSIAVRELATKYHVSLPLVTRTLDGVIYTRPALQLDKLGDKQKIFKLISEYSQVVQRFSGTFIAEDGEGRLKANAAWALLDEDVRVLYQQIRAVFDPYGTLNPGVKQSNDIKDLITALRPHYNRADFI
jgi:FAD/FMN-containing dehydrogenase